MPNINESLNKIMKIDGAIGAALVDFESGMTLGTIGDRLDMELAGAGTTEVVRAEKEIIDQLDLNRRIEDILITLESQYHMIRVFHENENLFTYLVLDKEKSNLALARMQLEEIDSELDIGLSSGTSSSSASSTASSGSRTNRQDGSAERMSDSNANGEPKGSYRS